MYELTRPQVEHGFQLPILNLFKICLDIGEHFRDRPHTRSIGLLSRTTPPQNWCAAAIALEHQPINPQCRSVPYTAIQ